MTEKKRDLQLDVIRTLAIFLVITVHFFDSSGFPGETLGGAVDWGMLCLWLLSHTCVPLFLMLSGWLCGQKRLSRRYYFGLVRILGLYLLCSIACLLFRAFYLREEITLRYIFGSLVNFYACGYAWYVMLYFGLFLMIPFLNLIWAGLPDQKSRRVLVATAFALSILPSFLNQYLQLYSIWWTRLYPLCYYFTGLYLREYWPRERGRRMVLPLLLVTALFALFDLVHYRAKAQGMIAVAYENYQVYLVSVLLFVCLLAVPTPGKAAGRFFTWVSRLSYGMYLLSWIPDNVLYPRLIARYPAPAGRYPWMLPCVVCVFLVSLGLSFFVQKLYDPLERALKR